MTYGSTWATRSRAALDSPRSSGTTSSSPTRMESGIRCRFKAARRDRGPGMSLINDALKTAQRERSGQVQSGSGGQPLLDGFFPYTSTGSPKGQANRARAALIAGAGLVVFGVGLWFAV